MPHKYIHNLQAFTNEDAVSYYLLGAYITDGCVSKNGCSLTTELKSKDKNWLISIGNIISPQSQIKKTNKSNCYRLRVANKSIATWLVEHECVPNKSLKMKMPKVPQQYLPDFIRGCIDGDGSIGTYKRNNGTSKKMYSMSVCYLVSASKSFIYEMQEILKQVNIHSTTSMKKTKGQITVLKNGQKIIGKHNQYLLKFTGTYCNNILQYCYYEGHTISMPRKNKLANQIVRHFLTSANQKNIS